MATGSDIAITALSQRGDPYLWGAWPDADEEDPTGEDCSGLTRWSHLRNAVNLIGGSWLQAQWLWQQGGEISIEEAIRTAGALLFSFNSTSWKRGVRPSHAHVELALGNRLRQTIGARSKRLGVNVFPADGRGWTFAAKHPKVLYVPGPLVVVQQPTIIIPPSSGIHPTEEADVDTFVVMHNGSGNPAANGASIIVRGGHRFSLDNPTKLNTALGLEKVAGGTARVVNEAGWQYYQATTTDGGQLQHQLDGA